MIHAKDVKDMENYVKQEDSLREELIAKSRTVLKDSKSAIYSIHRQELVEGKRLIDSATSTLKEIDKIIKKYPHMKYSADNAYEEYCEACLFYGFVNGKLPNAKSLNVDPIIYLQSLSDFTGELARKAVIDATAKKSKEVQRIRDMIDEVFGIMIQFDLRNGELRKKADAIKWNLNKVEELLHSLSR
jgi:predicted translin family RNA/ssDNA-binding protein